MMKKEEEEEHLTPSQQYQFPDDSDGSFRYMPNPDIEEQQQAVEEWTAEIEKVTNCDSQWPAVSSQQPEAWTQNNCSQPKAAPDDTSPYGTLTTAPHSWQKYRFHI